MPGLPCAMRLALAVIVLAAAVFDLRYRRIPNWLNLSGLILGLGLNLLFFHSHGAVLAGGGLLFATVVYLPLYMLRGMGAGDVKLMAAIGAIVGPTYWLDILIGTAIAGGAAAVVYAWIKGRFSETCCNLWFLLKDLIQLRAPHKTNPQLDFRNAASLRMPHGVVIAISCLTFVALEYFHPAVLSLLIP